MPKSPGLSRSTEPFLVAANVACSWLHAVKIPARQLSENMLIVDNRLEVTLYDSTVGKPDDVRGLAVDVRELASSATHMALAAWHRITIALGKGQPNPVNRGAPPTNVQWQPAVAEDGQGQEVKVIVGKKTVKTSDIMMSSLRLSEFRQSPDLPADIQKKYAEVIKSTTGAFFRRNRNALEAQGLTRQDLTMAALVWATNFHHRYRREDDERKTIKFLGNYIQQRCSQLARYGRFNTTSQMIYTDDLDSQAGEEADFSIEETTEKLRERVSYLPREELRRRVEKAVAKDAALASAAKKLLTMTPRVQDYLYDF